MALDVLRDGEDVERVERLEDVEREAKERPPFCAVRFRGNRSVTATNRIVIVLHSHFIAEGFLSRTQPSLSKIL